MSVGNLVRTPHCEITATLELLDTLGVTSEDLASLRSAPLRRREIIARLLKRDRHLEAFLTIEPGLTKFGAVEVDFLNLAVDDWKLKQVLDVARPTISDRTEVDMVKQWESFYLEQFGLTVDLSQVKIPPRRQGFNRLIIVANGLLMNRVYDTCAKRFKCWRYNDDLDASVKENDRDPNRDGTYAIWVKDVVEADENLKNLSANALAEQKIKGVTLLERMLHELKYFKETGKHLDISNVTLCSGSRSSDGNVPDVYWDDGGFRVSWDCTDDARPSLRAREAVTL